MNQDRTEHLQEAVRTARDKGEALRITGGGSKERFLGEGKGEVLSTADHAGIIQYDPTELVITARAGTRLADIDAALAEKGQMLASESPLFTPETTLGGAVACGFSGPRRPFAGALRDFILGCRIVNGEGEALTFGGRVMKNVAGYDISRLMAGAYGQLGVILDVSLKVLPRPEKEVTLRFAHASLTDATAVADALLQKVIPVTGTCYRDGVLNLRFSGSEAMIRTIRHEIGGETGDESLWDQLRNFTLDFFRDENSSLWRISVPPASAPLALEGDWFVTWNGAERWYRGSASADEVRRAAEAAGGHATYFWGGDTPKERFHPLSPRLQEWHKGLKQAFDPAHLFNPGLMYSWL